LKDVGFKTPESVLYDPEQDVYFVSNIDGKPVDADDNGFISKVGTDGKVIELKWIESKKKGANLDAPKGLAISGDMLLVADLTVVRMFDRKTGAPKGKVACPGSTFLNDVAVGPDGTVFVTDSGLKLGKDGLEPDGSDAIYKIGKSKRAEKLIAGKELGGPNGILADDKGLSVVTFGSSSLYRVGLDGKKEPDQKFPVNALDGLVKLSDGTLLVSSWGASEVLRGTPGGTFDPVIRDAKSPADIGYDTKRNVVLIPLFTLDAIELAKLPNPPPAAAEPAATPAVQKSEPAAPAAKAAADAKAPAAKGAAATPAPAAKVAAAGPAPAPAANAAPPAMTPGKPAAGFPAAPAATPAAAPAPAPAAPAPAKK
jgi:sugar lactone lactonase YvrE